MPLYLGNSTKAIAIQLADDTEPGLIKRLTSWGWLAISEQEAHEIGSKLGARAPDDDFGHAFWLRTSVKSRMTCGEEWAFRSVEGTAVVLAAPNGSSPGLNGCPDLQETTT